MCGCKTVPGWRILCNVLLSLVLALPQPLAAQQAQMANMQLMACNLSDDGGQLTLALMSLGEKTDPKKSFGFRDELEVLLEVNAESKTLVENRDLAIAVIGDLVRDADRKYTLFRFVLVMDESGSIDNNSLQAVRTIVQKFFDRIPVAYQVQIMRFSDQPQVMVPFTNDPASLTTALNLPRIFGGTAFYDAVDQAYTELRQAEPEVPLSFVIAFTDGEDTSSRRFASFQDFKTKIEVVSQRDQMPLFLAGIGASLKHQLMQQLAGPTGFYMPLQDLRDVDRLFETAANAIERTYVVRLPLSSRHQGLSTLYIQRRKSNGKHDTIQDVPLPAKCQP